MSMHPKILIVDDNKYLRRGIMALIAAKRPSWELCGEAADGEETMRAVAALVPDVVLLDVLMPRISGLEVAARIAKLGLRTRIVLLSAYDSDTLRIEDIVPPAHAYVDKNNLVQDLLPTIDRVLAEAAAALPAAGDTA